MQRTITARYRGRCRICSGHIQKGATVAFDSGQPRGMTVAHLECTDVTAPNVDTYEGATRDPSTDLYYFDGDPTAYARTRRGLRSGVENTGRRCIDAPCCGCC